MTREGSDAEGSQPAAVVKTPAAFDLQEPSIPGMDEVWSVLQARRRELVALLLALVTHVLLIALGSQRAPSPAPVPARPLSVHLQTDARAAPATDARRGLVLSPAARTVSMAPSSPPPASAAAASLAPLDLEMPAGKAPAALFDWWQYGQSARGYFSATEVDVRAEPVESDVLLLKLSEIAPGVAGRVRVNIYINEGGTVDRVELEDAVPPGVFDALVMQQIYQLQFEPAQKNGLFVKSVKQVVLTFDAPADELAPVAAQMPPVPSGNGVPGQR